MVVPFIAGLLLLITVNAENDSASGAYRSCKGKLEYPKRGTDLPRWCQKMRIDVGSCVSKKLKISDNGSIASRGNVLLSAFKQNPNSELLTDVKLYHYGCLYNNWRDYFDQNCYKRMVQDCVDGNKSCYYDACPGHKSKTNSRTGDSSGNQFKFIPHLGSGSGVHVPCIALVLTVIVFSINLLI
ncbi:hypothetical protein TELCIR_10051 [Teladorsagia circumcincta]|uniref:Uncharacterized protein n=1 Tax=Teladorsagia circumcincta TaxID=45464 RepID=A0A2G9UD63_TELCI|nr:hypothetical protein TELCIR_10051 [Teladorsagia circumcincta]